MGWGLGFLSYKGQALAVREHPTIPVSPYRKGIQETTTTSTSEVVENEVPNLYGEGLNPSFRASNDADVMRTNSETLSYLFTENHIFHWTVLENERNTFKKEDLRKNLVAVNACH